MTFHTALSLNINHTRTINRISDLLLNCYPTQQVQPNVWFNISYFSGFSLAEICHVVYVLYTLYVHLLVDSLLFLQTMGVDVISWPDVFQLQICIIYGDEKKTCFRRGSLHINVLVVLHTARCLACHLSIHIKGKLHE